MANTIVWADIPVTDMDRARAFYGALLQTEIPLMEGADGSVALLPGDMGSVSADLALTEERKPSTDGATVYLGSGGDIEGMAARAVAAGGQILMPPTDMGKMVGTIAFILDSEGNRIGLHHPPAM
jgi:predicted enzyme related to lactoylglutathione lyase